MDIAEKMEKDYARLLDVLDKQLWFKGRIEMDIAEKMEKDYASLLDVLDKQLCPHCKKNHNLFMLDKQLVILALTSAYLAGKIAGQELP